MSEIVSRLESLRQQLVEVEAALRETPRTDLAERLRSLAAELQGVISDLGAVPSPAPAPAKKKTRRRLPDVEKCPRCTNRSLHMIPEEVRQESDGTDEVMWRCLSCGHELWRKDD